MDTNIFHNAVKNLTSGKEWRCLTIPDSEKYFLDHFEIVSIDKNRQAQYSNDPSDFGFTWDELVAKNQELLDYEPMRLLKVERDRLLVETDWMSLPDSPEMTEDWKPIDRNYEIYLKIPHPN